MKLIQKNLFIQFAITIILISCAANVVSEYKITDPINPEWYDRFTYVPKYIALIPFQGSNYQSQSVASQLESEIRSKLIRCGQYNIIERGNINNVLDEQKFILSGLSDRDVIQFGKMLSADVIIVGEIPYYYEEENYSEYVEGTSWAGDEYRRKVTFQVNLRIISVETGQIVYSFNDNFSCYHDGYKNIRRINKKQESTGDDFLDALVAVAGAIVDIDLSIQQGIKPYADLRNNAVKEAVDYCCINLLKHKKKYEYQYKVDYSGNKQLIGKKFIGNIY